MHASQAQFQTYGKNCTPLCKTPKAKGAGGNTGAENKNSYDLDAEGILISRRCRQQLGLSFWLVKFGELLFLT